tara:strand:+ start:3836 stop:4018 length:183 start_codon:yes stop_codon:yes gene_type:complete
MAYTEYDKAIAAAIGPILATLFFNYLPVIFQTVEVQAILATGLTALIVWAVPNKKIETSA